MSDLSLLMDMGFPESEAEKALSVTGNSGVEAAMEWLLAHQNESEGPRPTASDEKLCEKPSEEAMTVDDAENIQSLSELTEVKCIKCDECNKKFQTDSEIEFHAVKTGHQSFSESTEEIKPLSEEDRKEQVKKIESLIKQRRAEKAEQDKKEALEREKSRRRTGQEITNARQKMQEEEIKQMAELKRREKLEDKMARQRVLEQIERDKQARREKFGTATPPAATPTPVTQPPPVESKTYDECRLQIRLTDGQCLTQTFNPKEELAAVRLFVEINRTDGSGPFCLMTNFPKKVYSDDDMHASLNSLGLVPSAVLIVSKQQ